MGCYGDKFAFHAVYFTLIGNIVYDNNNAGMPACFVRHHGSPGANDAWMFFVFTRQFKIKAISGLFLFQRALELLSEFNVLYGVIYVPTIHFAKADIQQIFGRAVH